MPPVRALLPVPDGGVLPMKALLLACLAGALWGTTGVANRLMTGDPALDPVLEGLTRAVHGAGSLLAAAGLLSVPWPAWRQLPRLPLLAFGVAGAVFQVCLFAAFDTVGVTVTVAVTVAGPAALVAVGDALWNRRPPELGAALAIALASAGVLLALAGSPRPAGPALVEWGGAVLLVAAACAFALVAAAARSLGKALHPLQGAGLGLAATSAALAGVLLARGASGLDVLAAMPGRDLAILGYTGVFATGGAYLAFVLGMRLSRSPTVGMAPTLIEPGVAAVLAAFILRERLSPARGGRLRPDAGRNGDCWGSPSCGCWRDDFPVALTPPGSDRAETSPCQERRPHLAGPGGA